MIILILLLKAMNKQSPELINIILLSYTTSKDNFKSILVLHGFNVGDIGESTEQLFSSAEKFDVYISFYQSDTDHSFLLEGSKLGLLFLNDCHQIIQKDKFNPKIIEFSKEFNFNIF